MLNVVAELMKTTNSNDTDHTLLPLVLSSWASSVGPGPFSLGAAMCLQRSPNKFAVHATSVAPFDLPILHPPMVKDGEEFESRKTNLQQSAIQAAGRAKKLGKERSQSLSSFLARPDTSTPGCAPACDLIAALRLIHPTACFDTDFLLPLDV